MFIIDLIIKHPYYLLSDLMRPMIIAAISKPFDYSTE